MTTTSTWWKDSVVYQIYPASYKDSNGDGLGDIPGIISELDHVKDLGTDIVWLSPHYDSPQYDMGYDISDYEKVYAPYGTMEDMDRLIKECHDRSLKLIVDLVINHTSHLHEWFKQSRSSKQNPYRDFYIWRPAKTGESGERLPPNNWRAEFGGSVWEWDEGSQEYYLHLFTPEQPDLNWENETCRKAIYASAIEFWLKKGVDGFRIDTVNMYSKPTIFSDIKVTDKSSTLQPAIDMYTNGPRMHEWLSEMNEILEKYDAMTVGELPNTPDQARVLKYVSAKEKQLNMVFQFDVVDLGFGSINRYDSKAKNFTMADLKKAIANQQYFSTETDGWSTCFTENHDRSRSISRYASDAPEYRITSGKMLAIMQATLSGTLFLYQGQEIGMINLPEEWSFDEYKDVDAINWINKVKEMVGNDEEKLKKKLEGLQHLGRDNARTPMQWNTEKHAGFTSGTPWMRVMDSYTTINVKDQRGNSDSVLEFWKKMIKIRKEHKDLFVHGHFKILDAENQNTFTYTKTNDVKTAIVVLNFSSEQQPLPAEIKDSKLDLLVANVETPGSELSPWEGRLYISSK